MARKRRLSHSFFILGYKLNICLLIYRSTQKYKSTRKIVIGGLSAIDQYEQAMDLAERHGDISCVVESVQKCRLSANDIKSRNIYYIELFGKEYYACLLQYLYKQGERFMTSRANLKTNRLLFSLTRFV
jgi:hypothetical protein